METVKQFSVEFLTITWGVMRSFSSLYWLCAIATTALFILGFHYADGGFWYSLMIGTLVSFPTSVAGLVLGMREQDKNYTRTALAALAAFGDKSK